MVEAVSTIAILALFGATVVIGYLGNYFFAKTRIPDIIWLLIFGLIIGPVLGLIDTTVFIRSVPFLASLALLVILFDAGLHMNIYRVIRDAPRSMVLAVSGILISMGLVGVVSMVVLGTDFLTGMLFGAILGGTSSPIVLTLMRRSKTTGKIKNILSLESAITDALTILVSLFILNIILSLGPADPLISLIAPFSIGAMTGLVAGLFWLFALDRLKGIPFSHMLTLSMVFILYASTEVLGGSGPISALFFGIVLGNGKNFSTMLKLKKVVQIDVKMKVFQDEITFFVRSFFFVLLGLLVVINLQIFLIGLLISAVLIGGRLLTAEVGMLGLHMQRVDKHFIRIMTPRGLAAAVLAQTLLVVGSGTIHGADIFSDIVFVVILITMLYSTVLTMIISRKIEMGSLARNNMKTKEKKRKRHKK